MFTDAGLQLAQFCQGETIAGFEEYSMSEWFKNGIKNANRVMFKGTVIENSLNNKEI